MSVTALFLLSDGLTESFEKKFKKRTIVKQYVYSPLVVGRMRIPEVVERLNAQIIDLLLVKLFYTGVVGKSEGYKFKYNISNRVLLENLRVISLNAISVIGFLKLTMMFGNLCLKFLHCRLLMILR